MSYKSYGSRYATEMKYDYNSPTKFKDCNDYSVKSAAYTPEYTLEIETTRASPDFDRSFEYTSNYVKNYPDSNYSSYVSSSALAVPLPYTDSKRQSVTSDYSSIGRTSSRQSTYTPRFNCKTSFASDYASTYRDSPPPSRSSNQQSHHPRVQTPATVSEVFSSLHVENRQHAVNTSSRTHEEDEATSHHSHHRHHQHHEHCNGEDHDGPCDHKNTPGYLKHRYGEDTNPNEIVSLRQHAKNQAAAQQTSEVDKQPERRSRSRRSRLEDVQNGAQEESEVMSRTRRNRLDEEKTDGKPAFKSRFAREVKMGGTNVSEPGKWVGSGFQLEPVLLTADKGHLIWTEPRGKLEIVFKYGHYDQNFSLFMDPQFKGVKVSEVKSKSNVEMILDGREDAENSKNHHRMISAARNKPENNFEFKSRNGRVTILLEALRGMQSPKANLFKLNYTMAL